METDPSPSTTFKQFLDRQRAFLGGTFVLFCRVLAYWFGLACQQVLARIVKSLIDHCLIEALLHRIGVVICLQDHKVAEQQRRNLLLFFGMQVDTLSICVYGLWVLDCLLLTDDGKFGCVFKEAWETLVEQFFSQLWAYEVVNTRIVEDFV